jgi:chromosome segregation protein
MENCDLLYGVTMEKKGVTKLVSIKLEQAKELVE